jgi:hypothetical protein
MTERSGETDKHGTERSRETDKHGTSVMGPTKEMP